MNEYTDILSKLDFNAVHSGDPIARAYFGESAASIRVLQRDAVYWKRMYNIEQGRRMDADLAADTAGAILGRIADAAQVDTHPKGGDGLSGSVHG